MHRVLSLDVPEHEDAKIKEGFLQGSGTAKLSLSFMQLSRKAITILVILSIMKPSNDFCLFNNLASECIYLYLDIVSHIDSMVYYYSISYRLVNYMYIM